MKGKGIVGGVIAIVGVIIMVVGIFRVVTSNFTAADIPTIVSTGFAWILYGAIIFIAGVVVVGFRNWVALILHLAALVPYYFAIQIIIQQGQAGNTQPLAYFNPSAIAWIIGIALNILGLVMNRVKIVAARKAPEAGAGTGAGTTPQTPPRP